MKKFFVFHQMNSGGSIEISDNVGDIVAIEAKSPREANKKAEEVGIYFDGVIKGIDCPCCGDAWIRIFPHEKPVSIEKVFEIASEMIGFVRRIEERGVEARIHTSEGVEAITFE